MKKNIFLSFMLVYSLFFSACKQDPPVPIEENKETNINFKAQVSGADLLYFNDYTDPMGYRYQIETFKFYVSNITLTNSDNEEIEIADVNLLNFKDGHSSEPVTPTTIKTEVPQGKYKNIAFEIGVDAARNAADPAQYEREHPLSLYQGMHWDWNTGYIFFNLEGRVDSTSDGSGTLNKSLLYHLGLDALLQKVDLAIDLEIGSETKPEVNIGIDINQIFASETDTVKIAVEGFSHTTESMELAEKIMRNTSKAFYIIK